MPVRDNLIFQEKNFLTLHNCVKNLHLNMLSPLETPNPCTMLINRIKGALPIVYMFQYVILSNSLHYMTLSVVPINNGI